MATSNYRPPPFPTTNVTPEIVAATGTVLTRRLNTSLRQAGGQNGASRTVLATTFISSTDCFVWADTTAGVMTLTLPRISEYTRMWVIVERVAGVNALTVAPRGTDTIDGAATLTVTKAVMLSPKTSSDWHVCMTSA